IEVAAGLKLGLPGLGGAVDGIEHAAAQRRFARAALDVVDRGPAARAHRPALAVIVVLGLRPHVGDGLAKEEAREEHRHRGPHRPAWTEVRSADRESGARAAGVCPAGETSSSPSRDAGTARSSLLPSTGTTR